VVDGSSLENWRTGNGTVSSNLTPSAILSSVPRQVQGVQKIETSRRPHPSGVNFGQLQSDAFINDLVKNLVLKLV
jgi:hypothetical protein